MRGRLIATIAAGCIAASAAGADTPAQGGAIETADAGPTRLDDISVTATRSPISSYSYPGMVTVIDRAEIEQNDPSTISDLMKDIPGVHFQGGPRRTSETPSIRGYGGENVQVRIDGARNNFVSGHDGRLFLDPALLSSAEVLRGPASSLYGSGALGGVLSFRTLEAGDLIGAGQTYGARAGAGYQDVNEEMFATLAGAARPTENLDLVLGGVYRDSDDIQLGSGATLISDDDIRSGLAKMTARPLDGLSATVSYLRFRNDAREPDNAEGATAVSSSNPLVDKDVKSDTLSGEFLYTPTGSNWIDLNVTAAFTDSQVDETAPTSGRRTERDVETMSLFADNRTRFSLAEGAGLTLTYGVEGNQDDYVGRDSTSSTGSRDGVPNADATVLGAFVQGEFEVAKTLPGTLRVIPGLRFDSFEAEAAGQTEDNSDREASPRIGVSYAPVPWLLGFANYAHAFRAPSVNELYLSGTHFSIPLGRTTAVNRFIANPDLKPEKSRTFEFGAGLNFDNVVSAGDAVRVKGAWYRSKVEDLIDLDVDFAFTPGCFNPSAGACSAGTTTAENVANAELEGFEIEASYDSRRFFARAAFDGIDGENTDTGEHLGILTPNRLRFNVGYKILELDSLIGFRTELADKFDEVNSAGEERDAYATFDVYARWAPQQEWLKGFAFNLGIDNLFDADYEVVNAGVSEPGRNFKASVTYAIAF